MGDQTQPLGPYDPTDVDRDFARAVLDRADDLDAHYVLGCIEGSLNPGTSLGDPHAPDERDIRRARAFVDEWNSRRAVES